MAFAPDGALWIGSTEAEICRFDVEQGGCTEFFAGEEGMAGGPLTSLAVDAGGSVYYTTWGSGYAVYDGSGWRTQVVRDPSLIGNQVRALAAGEDGDLWAATEAGVQRLVEEQAAELLDRSPSGIDLRAVTALAAEREEGGDGGLWVGGPGGAAFYDGSGWQPYTSADGLAGDDVRTIAVDAAGRTWFGTDRGISVWNGSSFFTIDRARGLPSDDIRALAADEDGVWIGAEGGGLYRYAGNQLQLLNRQNVGLPSDNVSALAVGPDGALWIGTDRGLARLAEGELVVDDDLGEQAITGLAVSSLGDVWAAAGDEGLFFYDGERWTQLTLADRLPSQRITALLADGDTVWLGGAEGGITRYRQSPE
jgi:ligand-binding sensor domain-containing protein